MNGARLSAVFSGCGSMQRRSLPFGFLTVTKLDSHSVGSVTFSITCSFSSLSSSSFNGCIMACGTRLGAFLMGWISVSTVRSTFSRRVPSLPSNSAGNCSAMACDVSGVLGCCLCTTAIFSVLIVISSMCCAAVRPMIGCTSSLTTMHLTLYLRSFLALVMGILASPKTAIGELLYMRRRVAVG